MSQRLSTSVTFQNLEDRVATLEAEQTLTQSKIITGLGYTPANVAGDTFNYVIANSFLSRVGGGGGTANLNGSSVPGFTGIVEFRKADGTRNGYIGFNAEAGAMNYGSDTGAGHYFAGGVISNDPAMRFGLRFNTVDGILDFDTGDYLYYSRSTDTFLFNIGGATKATLDSGGVLSVTEMALDGQFYQLVNGGNPCINFDSGGDAYLYDRPNNVHRLLIGGSSRLTVNSAGTFVANVLTVGDSNFGMSPNGGSPYVAFDSGDALLFNRSTNAYNLTLSNSTQLLVDPSGTFVANVLTVGDGNFGMSLNGGGQPISYFDSGDFLGYVRASNIFNFVIGSATKTTIDSSGNLVAYGALCPSADTNFRLELAAAIPRIQFDANDNLAYDRTSNSYAFNIAGSTRLSLTSSVMTMAGDMLATGDIVAGNDTNFRLKLASSDPQLIVDSGDYTSFSRSTNVYNWVIGNATKATLDSSGNLAAYGALLASADANFGLSIPVANNPRITFDTGGDQIVFDRSANKFYFVIGGVNVASIDTSGNLRIKGTLSQGVTP